MNSSSIPADKTIDPVKLQAWIDMNTVRDQNPSPGAAFIYIDDLMQGFIGTRLEPARSPKDVGPTAG